MSQLGDKLLVGLGLCSSQFVIEMGHGKHDAKFGAQIQHEPQQGDRIHSAGHGYTYAIASVEKALATDVGEHALRQGAHGNIVHPGLSGFTESRVGSAWNS